MYPQRDDSASRAGRILAVADLPRTLIGKASEIAVRAMIEGETVRNRDALANPEALEVLPQSQRTSDLIVSMPWHVPRMESQMDKFIDTVHARPRGMIGTWVKNPLPGNRRTARTRWFRVRGDRHGACTPRAESSLRIDLRCAGDGHGGLGATGGSFGVDDPTRCWTAGLMDCWSRE